MIEKTSLVPPFTKKQGQIHSGSSVRVFGDIHTQNKAERHVHFLVYFDAAVWLLQGESLLEFLDEKFDYLLNNSGYFLQLSTYLMLQKEQKFVLEELTLIDFFFNEICKFCLILFGNIYEQLATSSWRSVAEAYQATKHAKGVKNRTCEVLNVMKRYQNFYASQDFYKKDEAYFESFSYFPNMIDIQSHRQALQKLKAIDFLEMLYRPKTQ